ncbi:hypothetical protein KUTeg_024480 [Tegillarca granosa]|uniref:COMM domain-containing protein 6 n=1 Tax=Tegillarca granosa TaxID=220873 RepID=A0ABQ9DXE5_TEGGR|nr:hypothetical protein KUTeg_024480 [Tegillarca granosa]
MSLIKFHFSFLILGFSKTVELLNQLPESLLCEMCQEAVFSMRQNNCYTDLSKTEQRQSLMSVDEVKQMFDVGQLVDMQWKLGVGVSSDSCKNLNSPYVTMQVKVADPSGKLSTHTFEMTVMQFQDFSKQMKEMANVLETV